jgi:hypothetical protein
MTETRPSLNEPFTDILTTSRAFWRGRAISDLLPIPSGSVPPPVAALKANVAVAATDISIELFARVDDVAAAERQVRQTVLRTCVRTAERVSGMASPSPADLLRLYSDQLLLPLRVLIAVSLDGSVTTVFERARGLATPPSDVAEGNLPMAQRVEALIAAALLREPGLA